MFKNKVLNFNEYLNESVNGYYEIDAKTYPLKTVKVTDKNVDFLSKFGNFGPHGNLTGVRKNIGYYKRAIRCGAYIYNLDESPEVYDYLEKNGLVNYDYFQVCRYKIEEDSAEFDNLMYKSTYEKCLGFIKKQDNSKYYYLIFDESEKLIYDNRTPSKVFESGDA